MPANIDPAAGGAFSMFGRVIMGRNIELIPNQRIVQAWRPTRWDPGVYSIVKFELKTAGKRNDVDSRSFRISGRRIRPSLRGMEIAILGTAEEVSRIRVQPNRLKR
jgi:Activator of Hsp90 ATPase homolog 1-like protein